MYKYLICAAAFMICGSAHADSTQGVGLVCKTADEITQAFDFASKNPASTGQQVLDAVNKGSKDCDLEMAIYEKVTVVDHVSLGGNVIDVISVKIEATCSQGICVFTKEQDAFMAVPHEEEKPQGSSFRGDFMLKQIDGVILQLDA